MSVQRPHVVIADTNEDYAIRLEDKFLRMMRNNIELDVITSDSYYQSFFSAPVHVDVALISEAFDDAVLVNQDITALFFLSEEAPLMEEKDPHIAHVYKYTSLSHVFNQTMGKYSHLMQSRSLRQAPRCILCYSPVGGSGKTALAAGLAACLQEAGFKVLFVDAEYQQGVGDLFAGVQFAPNGLGMSMARSTTSPFAAVRDHIAHDVVDVLPPLKANLMTYGISFDAIVSVIEGAMRSDEYNYVVVDTDSVFSPEKLELVQMADALVIPAVQSKMAAHKISGFLNSLDTSGRGKCHLVLNNTREGSESGIDYLGAIGQAVEGSIRYERRMDELTAEDLAKREDFTAVMYLVK